MVTHLICTKLSTILVREEIVTYNNSIISGIVGVIKGETRVAEENTLVVLDVVEGDPRSPGRGSG